MGKIEKEELAFLVEKYLDKMEELELKFERGLFDNETYHIGYDELIIDFLKEIGYETLSKKYKEASSYFWYS